MNTSHITTYSEGKDNGYIGLGMNWWSNPRFKDSFLIFDLDSFYQDDYFQNDHVDHEVVKKYVDYILEYGKSILGRNITSVLEAGSAGGWFTEEFVKRNINIIALEGSKVGYEKTKERIGKQYAKQVVWHDLRLPLQLKKQFDIAICTEVAEHIEPPFSSQLIQLLTDHTKLVWFSFEPPETNEQHYHHSNEQPEKFWQNLFKFYHFNMLKLPGKVYTDTEGRGGYIFYHESVNIPPTLKKYIININNSSDAQAKNLNSNEISHLVGTLLLALSNKLQRLATRIAR